MRLALRDHARVAAVLGLALGAIALGGCSKKNVREPAELKDIVNPAIKLQTVWTASAGNGGGKYYSELTLRSEEHTSELQSLMRISYAVFCLKKKKKQEKLLIEARVMIKL